MHKNNGAHHITTLFNFRIHRKLVSKWFLLPFCIAILFTVYKQVVSYQTMRTSGSDSQHNKDFARDLYHSMVDAFHDVNTIMYTCRYSHAPKNWCSYRIWIKKPNRFRIESESITGRKGVYIGDGDYAWMYWPDGRPMYHRETTDEYDMSKNKVYLQFPTPQNKFRISYKMVRLGSGFSLSIIDPSCFLGATDNLEHTIVDFDYVKQGKYAGEQCHVIDVVYLDGQRTRRLWISNKDHLPRRLIDTVKVHNRELVTEEIWQDIKPNINIADNRFKWQPPDDWSRFFLPPKKGHKHMKGQFAPDFEFTTINGSKIRLANLRGKVVWLVFWRLGCPPCRLELPRLQKVYDKHKDQGGYVLAFNFSDGIELVKQYCSQNSFTFPMILDHSDEAIDIGTQVYGATSFPYNYIIDSNGIILHVEEGMVMDSSWESLEVFENEISKGF